MAFFQICVVVEVVVGLMADDSPLQSRPDKPNDSSAPDRLCASCAGVAANLQRIRRLLVLQHGLAIHAEMAVRAMALTREAHAIDETILRRRGGVRPIGDFLQDVIPDVLVDVNQEGSHWYQTAPRRDLGSEVDSAASAVPARHADAVGADLA